MAQSCRSNVAAATCLAVVALAAFPAAAEGPRPYIAGGTTASIGDFPWQVAIVSNQFRDPQRAQFCGGSIVYDQWVLTAAHCVTDPNGNKPVNANTIDIVVGTATFNLGGQRISIDRIVVHPEWYRPTGENDIALLHTARPLQGTDIQAVDIADTTRPIAGDLVVTGWGQQSAGGSGTGTLLKTTIPYVDNQTCAAAYGSEIKIRSEMMCAGPRQGGQGACKGDSGGPLVTYGNGPKRANADGPFAIQVGIVSWSSPGTCAAANKYGVYTRVAEYRAWIMQTIGLYVDPSRYQPALGETWNQLINAYWERYPFQDRSLCDQLDPVRFPNLNFAPSNESPIALGSNAGVNAGFARPEFHYDGAASNLALVNDGHAVQLVFDPGRYQPGSDLRIAGITQAPPQRSIKLGGTSYDLKTLEFHHPSEHVLDQQRYPLEIQIQHGDLQHGGPNPPPLAVIALLVSSGRKNDALAAVFDKMNQIKSNGAKVAVSFSGQDLTNLLPSDKTYFGYQGSLTRPPCYNDLPFTAAQWIVLKTPIEASPDQIEKLKNAIRYGGAGTPVDARQTQARHQDYAVSPTYK